MVNIVLNAEQNKIKIGQEFDMFIYITNITKLQDILGFHHVISFDTKYLKLVNYNIATKSLLNPIIGVPIVDIDNKLGIIDFNLVRAYNSYQREWGLVYKIKFRSKKEGITELIQNVSDLRDRNCNPIESTCNKCRIAIGKNEPQNHLFNMLSYFYS
jgi:hypothetical protein